MPSANPLTRRLQEGTETIEAERAMMHEEMCGALHTMLDLKVRIAEGLDAIDASVSAPAPTA